MFWTHTGISRVLTSLVGAFFILTGVAAMPAMAQFSIPCNSSAVYTPDIAAYGFSSVDIKGAISSSNPAVATGTRGRAGGGTAGAITIKSNGQSGETTVTYTIEDFSGKTKQIVVAVAVDCPAPQRPPENPPQQPPQTFGTLDFVYTDCKECVHEAETLNKDIVTYNLAKASGAPSAELGNRAVKIKKDQAAFKDCVEKKCGPQPPLTQRTQVKHYPEPHRVVTRCKDPACIAIQDKLNADIDAFNQAVVAGKTPTDQLDAMLANINREGQELNACEKKCVQKPAASASPPPPATPTLPRQATQMPPPPTTPAPAPKPAPSPTPQTPPPSEFRPQDQVMMRWTGPNAGVQLTGVNPLLTWSTVFAATGETTDRDTVLGIPGVGAGLTAGYATAVATPVGRMVADAFLSFNYLGYKIEQPLGGSSFLAAKSNYQATAGLKFGPPVGSNSWVYGIAGISLLNETLQVANFVPEVSSKTTTVPGLTVGLGGAAQLPNVQLFGHSVALSLEYKHSFWQTARYVGPPSWGMFNFNFRRDDDALELGVTVYFNPAEQGQ
jgi:hypothetical protein